MKSLFKTHPVVCFIALTFAIAYLVGLPLKLFVLNGVFEGSEIGLNYLSKILVVFAPAISAVILTSAGAGTGSVVSLLKKLKPDTEHIIWWLVFIVGGFAITMAAFIISGFNLTELVELITASSPFLLVMHLIGSLLLIGIGEELGWRGWLLPKLLETKTPAKATLVVFVVWALWHLPMFFAGYQIAIPFTITCFALSVIFTRFWDHVNGNIFVLAVAHASVDFPQAFFEGRLGAEYKQEVLYAWGVASAIYLLIAIAVYLYNRAWWHRPSKPYVDEIGIPIEDRPGLD